MAALPDTQEGDQQLAQRIAALHCDAADAESAASSEGDDRDDMMQDAKGEFAHQSHTPQTAPASPRSSTDFAKTGAAADTSQIPMEEDDNHAHLAEELGVPGASVAQLRSAVVNEYRTPGGFTLRKCRKHLRYLFSTHDRRQSSDDLRDMAVVDSNLRLAKPHQNDVYLPNATGLRHVLTSTQHSPPASSLPSEPIIHPALLEDVPEPANGTRLTWERWLCDFMGIRDEIRLLSADGNSLSPQLAHIATFNRPALLHTLAQLWWTQGSSIPTGSPIVDVIRQLPVPCRAGGLYPLWETYLPVDHLVDYCRRYLHDSQPFPFLDLGDSIETAGMASTWSNFGAAMNVTEVRSLGFMLDILGHLVATNEEGLSLERSQSVMRLYCDIESACANSSQSQATRETVRSYVQEIGGLLVPEPQGSIALWARTEECVWDAPDSLALLTRYTLRPAMDAAWQCSQEDMALLSDFFQHTMSVPQVTRSVLLAELSVLSEEGSQDHAHVRSIYRCLEDLQGDAEGDEVMEGVEDIRQAFEDEALILCRRPGSHSVPGSASTSWHRRSECLWSESTTNTTFGIPGKCMLNREYSDAEAANTHQVPGSGAFRQFFTGTVGVEQPTIDDVLDEMNRIGSLPDQPHVSQLKEAIWILNSMLPNDHHDWNHVSTAPTPARLRRLLLPVKHTDGTVHLAHHPSALDFAIADRRSLADRFAGRISLLDFDVDDVVARLEPRLLAWAGLRLRYLSRLVLASTSVDSGCATFPIAAPSRDLCTKADAIFRIAAAFKSPRYAENETELYAELRYASTVEASSISSRLTVVQNGVPVSVPGFAGEAHISEAKEQDRRGDCGSDLTIHVPRNKDAQDICFAAALPKALAAWLTHYPGGSSNNNNNNNNSSSSSSSTPRPVDDALISALQSVIQCPAVVCDLVLEHHGIPLIAVPSVDGDPHPPAPTPASASAKVGISSYGVAGGSISGPRHVPMPTFLPTPSLEESDGPTPALRWGGMPPTPGSAQIMSPHAPLIADGGSLKPGSKADYFAVKGPLSPGLHSTEGMS